MPEAQIDLIGVSPAIDGLHWQAGQLLRIGRQGNLDIVVNEPSLSRLHAEIRVTPKGWIVQDHANGSPTLLNGVPVGKVTRTLRQDDVLQCGRLVFKVAKLTLPA